MPLFVAPKVTFVTVNMYPRPPDVVVAFAAHSGLARPRRVSMSPHLQDPVSELSRILLPGTSVNKGKQKDREV
jgi:hypothetical protein